MLKYISKTYLLILRLRIETNNLINFVILYSMDTNKNIFKYNI